MSAPESRGNRIPVSQDGEDALQRIASDLEVIAEEVRNRGMRGHKWGELLPQWARLREIEEGTRWMIEGPASVASAAAVPDLLAALKMARTYVINASMFPANGNADAILEDVQKINAAIRKAEAGGAS
jgi:hypothetical protein